MRRWCAALAILGALVLAAPAVAADNDRVWKTPRQLERYIVANGASIFEDHPGEWIDRAACHGVGPSRRSGSGLAFRRFTCYLEYRNGWELTERGIDTFVASFAPGGWTWGHLA